MRNKTLKQSKEIQKKEVHAQINFEKVLEFYRKSRKHHRNPTVLLTILEPHNQHLDVSLVKKSKYCLSSETVKCTARLNMRNDKIA